MGRPKHFMLGGIIALSLGVVLFAAGLLVGFLVPDAVDTGVKDALPTYKEELGTEDYQEWLYNNYEDATPYYRGYTFFNLTNQEDVQRNGANPIVQPVGPYVYRYYTTKFDVEFLNNGEQVQYRSHDDFFFVPEMSAPGVDPLNDQITGVNPSYFAVLNNPSIGNEKRLTTVFIGPIWAKLMAEMIANYPAAGISAILNSYIVDKQQSLIETIVTDDGVDNATATSTFYEIFANSTTDPTYSGFTSAMRLSVDIPLGLTLDQVESLLNPIGNYSVTNPQFFSVWYKANKGDAESINELRTALGLTTLQLDAVISWLGRFTDDAMPTILSDHGLSNKTEIGLYQWATGNFAMVEPSLWSIYPVHIEFAYVAASFGFNGGCSLTSAKKLLNALVETQPMVLFVEVYNASSTTINVPIGVYSLSGPAQYYALNSYFYNFIGGGFVTPLITPGGMFRTQAPHNWLWQSEDPLLTLLGNPNATNFFDNATMTDPPSTFITGHNNIDHIMEYVKWQNQSELVGKWKGTLAIAGTDATKFKPSLEKSDSLLTWVSELLRPVKLVFSKIVKLHGIELYRYVIADEVLDLNDFFHQSIRGFGNMTSNYNGAPIFLSKPYFLDADTTYLNKVVGVTADRERDDTNVDVEPISGVAMRAFKRLQLNAFVDDSWSAKLNTYNAATTKGLFYPILAVNQFSQLTEQQAKDYKKTVYTPLTAARVVLGVGVAVGAALMIIGVGLIVYTIIQRKKGGNKVEMY